MEQLGIVDIVLMVILAWTGLQVLVYFKATVMGEQKDKKAELISFHKKLVEKEGLVYKKLIFFNLGGTSYTELTKRTSVNAAMLDKHSVAELKYLLAREVGKQKAYAAQGSLQTYEVLFKDRQRNKYFISSLLISSVTFGYLNILEIPKEHLENLHSLIYLPSNILLLTMVWNSLVSKDYKSKRIALSKEMDNFADTRVGGGASYWEKMLKKKTPKYDLPYQERFDNSKKNGRTK